MPEFIEAQIVKGEVLNVECEVLSSINIPHLTLNIEPPAPLTACAEGKEYPLTSCAAQGVPIANRKSGIADPLPSPLSSLNSLLIRPATLADVPFIDRLQKKQSKQVGWFSTKTIEGKIALGHVLIAETGTADGAEDADLKTDASAQSAEFARTADARDDAEGKTDREADGNRSAESAKSAVQCIGYLIGNDRYHKRDELGCIFQINVDPAYRRHLVAARLLKAQFDRSAYGCRLYCCWCAQDIEANRFWESMGFVPLAFRAGSRKRDRVHIFWQKRIRKDDTGDVAKGGTPWWFPSLTGGGSLREDRIVLPIPPGVKWDQEMPRILPQPEERRETSTSSVESLREESEDQWLLPDGRTLNPEPRSSRQVGETASRKADRKSPLSSLNSLLSSSPGKLRFSGAKATKPKPERRVIKFTPEQMAMSREVRDRWQEQVNAGMGEQLVALPMPKYDLTRSEARIETRIEASSVASSEASIPLLEAA